MGGWGGGGRVGMVAWGKEGWEGHGVGAVAGGGGQVCGGRGRL